MNQPENRDRPVTNHNMRMGWGSDVAAEMLRRLDIEFIALNPGASFRGFHDSLVNYLGNRDPQLLLCLHEDHAVAIAHGYAKASDRAMGVALHANVGLMHALMGIFNAWCDRAPMLIMGATGPGDPTQRRPWIDWIHTAKDQGALLRHSVKWDDEPRSPQALVESMMRAGILMRTPPMGPAYICLDVALQEAELEQPVDIPPIDRFRPGESPCASEQTVARAAALLLKADRPLILMGRSSRSRESWDRRVRLAELLAARVATDLKCAASFPTNHPLHLGDHTLRISPKALEAARDADVILLLDWVDPASFFDALEGGVSATVINCSLQSYLHNGWSMDHFGLAPADLSILAEPENFTAQLVAEVERRLGGTARLPAAESSERTPVPAAPKKAKDAAISPDDIGLTLNAMRGGRAITLARVPIGWSGNTYAFTDPLDYLGFDGGGGLSSGPGNTIGAALALRDTDRTVIGILGDGDFLQGASALWTAARYSIPALFMISNNRANYTDVGHQETMARQRNRPVENRWIGQEINEPSIDFTALAQAQGVDALGPITQAGDLAAALQTAMDAVASGKPFLLDVLVQQN